MTFNLMTSDWIVVFLFVASLVIITWWCSHKKSDTVDFLLAGRKLTLPLFVATLVATFYGGIFGISEFVGQYGLGAWLTQGIFWYFVYLIFAIFLAKRICNLRFYTIPDILEFRYGRKVALLGGIFTYLMLNPAAYILSLGVIFSACTGMSLAMSVIICTVFTALYTLFGGFRGVVYTDVVQFIMMYLGFFLLACFTIYHWGGIAFLETNLTRVAGFERHLTLTGGMDWGYILVWAGISCWVLVDPTFYQRCYASSTPNVARNGVLISIVFWFIFDVLSCGTALYAFAAQNAGDLAIPEAKMAYLVLAEKVLPSPLKGLFLAGVLATIMSTLDSFLFAGAINISHDWYGRWFSQKVKDARMILVTRISVVLTAALGMLLAIALPSVVDIWYTIGTVGLSALLVPVVYAFVKKTDSKKEASSNANSQNSLASFQGGLASFLSMISGFSISVGWLLIGIYRGTREYPKFPYDIQPLYPGLFCSLVVFVLLNLWEHIRENRTFNRAVR